MFRNHLTVILLLFFAIPLFSQKNTLEGGVTDSTGIGLPGATIVLMQAKDSVLASFGVSDGEGRFLLKRVETGDYLLQVSYVGFSTHWQPMTIAPDAGKTDAGRIILAPASADLDAIEVTGERVPLRMRNDTLEYNANAFKTQPGSVVEDLLKKLPGVEVGRDGTIKAQGETVQSVLVDGKEFFGNDPKIATKNLPADAVDKVQVFDKKSEMAEFTGIEDGQDSKTINLSLKEGKKNGYFGKAEAGGGALEQPDGSYDFDRFGGKFNLNRFSKNSQFSAIGMGNNINQQGFSFNEYLQFMGGLSSLMSGGGGGGGSRKISLSIGSDSGLPISGAGGLDQGLTNTWAGGLNFNRDFGKKTKLSTSYFFNRIKNDLDRTVSSENLLGDGSFQTEEKERRISENLNHRFNMTLRHEIDSFQNIILRSSIGYNDAKLNSDGGGQTFGGGILQNENSRLYNSDGTNFNASSNFTYRRRFDKKGRAFVADLVWGMSDDRRNGRINSLNSYFNNDILSNFDTISQRQHFSDDAMNYGATLSFTEPLGKKQYVELAASRQNYTNGTVKDFYDVFGTEELFNEALSNRFTRGYRYDRAGLNYLLNRKKYTLTAGAALQNSNLKGNLPEEGLSLERNYLRVLPSVFFDYEIATSENFNLEYTTNLREPSLEQLQPVVDNSDPLNTFTGNPNLRPEYVHDLGGRFMFFDQFTFTSFFANGNVTYTKDRITNASTVDSFFRRNIMPVNVDHDMAVRGGLDFGTPLRFIKTNIRLGVNSFWNKSILFVNSVEDDVTRLRNTFSLSFDNRKKDKIDLTIGAKISHNRTAYSVSEALNQTYLDKRFYADLILTPSEKWELTSSFDYTVYSKEVFGGGQKIPLWRAGLSRYVLKGNRGQIRISAFDLLNKNLGISRTSQLNYVQEERTRSLGRYVMLTFAYSISGFGNEGGGIEIKMGSER